MSLAPPPLAPLHPRDDPPGVKLIPPLGLGIRLGTLAQLLTAGIALELLTGPAEELAATLRGAQLLGQLITPRLAELLILRLVGRLDPLHDLHRDLPKLLVALPAGVGPDPSAIHRHHPRLHQPSLSAQPQHLAKQSRQRQLVTANEPRDRHMIRNQVPRDHPVGHMLTTMTLDRPRGPHPRRKPIQDQRQHHRRLIRRPAMTIRPVGRIERPKIQAPDRVNHKPRQMIRRNPIPDIRRQQKTLLTTTLNEVLRHPQIVQTAPDRTPFVKQPPIIAAAGGRVHVRVVSADRSSRPSLSTRSEMCRRTVVGCDL